MPTLSIPKSDRQRYRALAHHLKPVVLIGDQGLSEAVLQEIDTHLKAHQLIKIRVNEDERSTRSDYLAKICDALDAEPIHHVGKTLTIFRRNPFKPALLTDTPKGELHNPMRRDRNEPYTPKKYAAEGLKKTKAGKLTRRKPK